MSLQGLQDYTQALTLLGKVSIKGTLNAKNVYVSGVINGAGISTDILATTNTWTGTNDFQNTTSYTGVNTATGNDLITKDDVDTAVSSYDPLPSNNDWEQQTTFSNAVPPTLPTSAISNNLLVGYTDFNNYILNTPTSLVGANNTWTGTNNYTGSIFQVGQLQLQVPTASNQVASKAYIDGKIEVAGKTLTYTILTPGTYNFPNINRANIGKIDFILFGGSLSGVLSGSVVSGCIGNGNGLSGSLVLNVGINNDTINYETYDQNVKSNTSVLVSNNLVACAGGACIVNGTNVAGTPIQSIANGQQGLSVGGSTSANVLAYSNILGTLTSAGGAILVAHYL
jgi:uncharacterized membrane protein